jgi:hypothetical protein
VTWGEPELELGVEPGELRPLDDEPFDVPEPDVVPEPGDVPEPDVAWCVVPAAEPDDVPAVDAVAAPGRMNATPPAAIRLAAVAEIVTARSRARPRSLAAAPDSVLGLRWLMAVSVPFGSRQMLWASSQPAMSASGAA